MVRHIIALLEATDRYFEKSGMYSYEIEEITVIGPYWVRMKIFEMSPDGKKTESFVLEFCNGAECLCISIANTGEDVFDYADELGWDDDTIKYIKCGTKVKEEE